MDLDDHDAIAKAFHDAVNMTPSTLERWLGTTESREVGYTHEGDAESVGHHAGREIVAIKRKKKTGLDDADYALMRKVVGYVHRHMAQKPSSGVEHSRWRYSLMNWGHDPLST